VRRYIANQPPPNIEADERSAKLVAAGNRIMLTAVPMPDAAPGGRLSRSVGTAIRLSVYQSQPGPLLGRAATGGQTAQRSVWRDV
jgi:hypothetical protein